MSEGFKSQSFKSKRHIGETTLKTTSNQNLGKSNTKKTNANQSNITTQSIPNENIFTNENYYRMSKFLSFDNNITERNCKLDLLMRILDLLKLIVILSLFKSIFFLLFYWRTMSFSIFVLNIIDLLLMILVELMIIKVEQIPQNDVYLRLFLEFDIWIVIISRTFFDDYTEFMIPIILFIGSFYNILFAIPMDLSFAFLTSESLILLMTYDNEEQIFFFRLIYNIFSKKCLSLVIYVFLMLMVQHFFQKGAREIWALYDSFKRSYFNFKFIYDDYPYPIFIVSRKNDYTIHYSNDEANKFYQKITKNIKPNEKIPFRTRTKSRRDVNIKEVISSFSQLIEPRFRSLFEREIEKSSNVYNETKSCRSFNFPFLKEEGDLNYIENDNSQFLFNGELVKYDWYKIVISLCNWKIHDSIIIELIEINDFIGKDFINEYSMLLDNEYSKMIDDIDLILTNTQECAAEKKVQSPINSMFNIVPNKITKSPNLFKPKQSLTIRPDQIEIHKNLAKLVGQNLNSAPIVIDYSLIYFFKFSLNYIYDYNLTLTVFESLKICKFHNRLTKFSLINFLNYMILYLYIPSKKQISNVELNCRIKDDIVANYDFIINNSQSNIPNDIRIFVEYENLSEIDGIFKFSFEFNENSALISYDKIRSILESNDNLDCTPNQINKFKLLDVGVFVSYFIIVNVYKKNLKIETRFDQVKISFEINGKYVENKNLYDSLFPIYSEKIFLPPKQKIDISYYSRLLNKIYNGKYIVKIVQVTSKRKVNEVINSLQDLNSSVNISGVNKTIFLEDSDCHDIYSNEKEDVFIKKDDQLFITIKLQVEKINNYVENTKKVDLIKKVSLKNFNFTRVKNGTNVIIWDNTSMMKNMKYCTPPRFLIVEDNVVGRMGLRSTLKRVGISYKIDYAANGREAVRKHKNLFDKGFLYDIIFMDIELPEMKGVEASTKMREVENEYENIHTNIIAVTVSPNIENKGVIDNIIEKPINLSRLSHYIFEFFSNKRPELKIESKEFK